jgi:hypothetical protein
MRFLCDAVLGGLARWLRAAGGIGDENHVRLKSHELLSEPRESFRVSIAVALLDLKILMFVIAELV